MLEKCWRNAGEMLEKCWRNAGETPEETYLRSGALSLGEIRSGTKLEKTSLSTGVFPRPSPEICFFRLVAP